MNIKLKKLRKDSGLTLRELDEKVNINYSQLARIERGESYLTQEHIKILTDFFGVSADYLLGLPENAISYNDNSFKPVRLLTSVYAGNQAENSEREIDVLMAMVDDPENYFYVQMHDDSMEPTFIKGDHVLIKRQQTAQNNQLVFGGVIGEIASVRRLKSIGGEFFLFCDNNSYEPVKIEKDYTDNIVGIVESFIRKVI